MRSKAPLALMEQMVMVLVFALAAALCLQAFALADRISRQNAERDQALVAAQNAAEQVKQVRGRLGFGCAPVRRHLERCDVGRWL